jgi:hypothetical protein
VAEIAGLKLIVPTSVAGTGASVSATGKVSFGPTTGDINVNGVFTSTYDNYLIVVRATSTVAETFYLRLRLSGTDATGGNYARQELVANSTTVSGSRATNNVNGVGFFRAGSDNSGAHMYIYGPALAQPTATRSVNVSSESGGYITDSAGTHSLSTAYDGFTLFNFGTKSVTGILCVYGLSQ